MTQTNTPTEETYDALNFDGLERRANYRFIGFREDMLQIFDKKDAASVLYQIVWRWQTETRKEEVYREINKRKKLNLPPLTQQEAEDMMYVYMSYNDFVRETGGAVGYNTVVRTLDYLVHIKKALLQKENHDPRFSDYEYSINKEVVRELLKELPESPFVAPKIPKKKSGSTHLGIADSEGDNPARSTQMGTVGIPNRVEQSTQMGTEVYPFGGTSHNYTHTTHITPITEESVGSIERNTPSLSLTQEEIALILSLRQTHHLGSEHAPEIVHAPSLQSQPTPVASSHNAPPFETTVPGSGDSTLRSSGESHHTQPPILATQDSGFLPAHESTNTSQQRITSNEPSTTSQAISASPQRENEPLSTKGTEASELRIACDTPEPDEQPPSRQKPRTRKPATEKPAPPAQPDLSQLSEQEQQVYAMLRAEDKPKYLAYSPAKREVYNNWLGSYGFAVSVDITPKFDECLNRAIHIHPSAEDFKNWRATLKKQDNEKLPEKRYFKNRNPQIWDVMRDIASLREMIDTTNQNLAKNPSSPKASMTKDQACKLAHDIMEQARQYSYTVQAQAVSSAKVEGAWVVHVKWEGAYVPVIKSAEQWQKKFQENHDILQFDAQFDKKMEGAR